MTSFLGTSCVLDHFAVLDLLALVPWLGVGLLVLGTADVLPLPDFLFVARVGPRRLLPAIFMMLSTLARNSGGTVARDGVLLGLLWEKAMWLRSRVHLGVLLQMMGMVAHASACQLLLLETLCLSLLVWGEALELLQGTEAERMASVLGKHAVGVRIVEEAVLLLLPLQHQQDLVVDGAARASCRAYRSRIRWISSLLETLTQECLNIASIQDSKVRIDALHEVRHGVQLLGQVGVLGWARLKRRLRVRPQTARDLILLHTLGGPLHLVRVRES